MHLKARAVRHTGRFGDERGFTMLLAVVVLAVTTLLIAGTYVAVLNDTGLSRNDLDQKRALAAAQAGIQAYNFQLNQNVNYWENCSSVSNVTVSGSTSADAGSLETYTVTPVVASTAPSGTTQCSTVNPIGTMIEGSTAATAAGTFRIQSTGYSCPTSSPAPTCAGGVHRTIVAQYRSPSFLNFVYYTDYEVLDPSATPGNPTGCAVHYPSTRGNGCQPIEFVTGDSIKGPMHSEDWLLICGSPVFGRTSADQIQAAGHSDEGTGCGDSATMTGTFNNSSPSLLPPSTNAQILNVTQAAFHYTGVTTIVLNGASMTVTNANINGGVAQTVADPTNGVVYVSTSATLGCPVTYTPFNPSYTGNTGCGNVYVSGNYNTSLTIASDNDIIINGSITTPVNSSGVPTGTAVLGLIANDFVRIYHPVVGTRRSGSGQCDDGSRNAQPVTNDPASLQDPTIYAAILAVNHSFIVDNYDCGANLGTLNVYGAIAQLYRGPVGTGGGNSGYLKDYKYDDRLATTEPPYFLNPVSAHWSVSRQTECDVVASC
jgi:Tfp pilus assembly protein PilX